MAGRWHIRDVCPCGWSVEPSFGNPWFTDNEYPVCPDCGADHSERELQTGRFEKQPKEKWWHFPRNKWTEKDPTP